MRYKPPCRYCFYGVTWAEQRKVYGMCMRDGHDVDFVKSIQPCCGKCYRKIRKAQLCQTMTK